MKRSALIHLLAKLGENEVFLILIMGILMTGCTISGERVDFVGPNSVHLQRTSAYGTVGGQGAIQHGADGSTVETYDTTQSFGNAMTAATTAGLASIAGSVSKAATASNNAVTTSTAKTAAGASVAKASIAAKQATTTTALGNPANTVKPITVNAP